MSSVRLISRTCAVLDALAGPPVGVTALAARVGLPKSTTGRLLQAMAEEGLVEQVSGGTDYRLGSRVTAWAAAVRPSRSLVAVAQPHLRALAAATGEASGLTVAEGAFVNHLLQEEGSPHPVLVRDWTGTRSPMHATAPGLVFLSRFDAAELDAYLAAPLERLAGGTMTDPAQLRARLSRVRAAGYAMTRDEVGEGISSIAAPIVDASGVVAGCAHVHWPTYRFPDADSPAVAAIRDRVIATAVAISEDLARGA